MDSPPDPNHHRRARQIELLIGWLLRIGVTVSFLIILAGTIISFVRHPDYTTSADQLARLTRPGAAFPHTLADVAQGIGAVRGQAIVAFGLLVLIATPVLRVAVSILAFLYERDAAFTLITSLVLVLLLVSFLLGRVGE